MSIQSEITRISGNVSDALDAIANKGVTVPSGSNSDDLATLIGQIQQGGGQGMVVVETQDSHGGTIVTITGEEIKLQSKGPITPTTSAQTIEPDTGYTGLSQVSISAMPSGTAGTPTATKGTVSNHSVSVTPSVTNTTGYITGSTKTGTAVSVSASELVSGTYTVDSSGTKDVANYASASVPAGTAGTPSATKGTVSNHSVTVTPSVTNQTGWITGSTKTGTAVTVTAAELESGTKSITANGTGIDVTGYAAVDVAVPTGSSKSVQVVQSTSRTTATSLTKVSGEITVSKTGTYDIYWSACRTNTSSSYTWGTRMYIGNTAYGTENTTWSNNTQNNHLTNVSLTADQKISVYARGRGGSYYAMVPMLLIIEA